MKTKIGLVLLGAVLVGGGILVGRFVLGGDQGSLVASPSPKAEKSPQAQVANPAAVYCEKEGGVLRQELDSNGARGICVLPDGVECEEWEFFRGQCPTETEASPEAEAEDDEVAFKNLFVQKYDKDLADVNLRVSQNTGSHASGSVSFAGEMGGGYWYAAYDDGEWVLVADGHGVLLCDDIEPYNFPASIIPECFDEASGESVTR